VGLGKGLEGGFCGDGEECTEGLGESDGEFA